MSVGGDRQSTRGQHGACRRPCVGNKNQTQQRVRRGVLVGEDHGRSAHVHHTLLFRI